MSRDVVHHRDGSKTVTFGDGHKVTFGARRAAAHKRITGTPYLFARGMKIDLPSGIAHGMIFEYRGKTYVAMRYRSGVSYGQPIILNRS